jgi:hypothetical protein
MSGNLYGRLTGLTREAVGAGRAKFRLSRGFPHGFAQQCHPTFSFGLFDNLTPPEQDPAHLRFLS